MRSSSWLRFV